MIFAQMLEIVALNDLASVLCARKFSFIIIFFKALKLAATVFMYYFNLAAAERSQHCALVGLSVLAEGPMDSRSFVRACVRLSVTRYLEIRASDFSETWHKVASWRD